MKSKVLIILMAFMSNISFAQKTRIVENTLTLIIKDRIKFESFDNEIKMSLKSSKQSIKTDYDSLLSFCDSFSIKPKYPNTKRPLLNQFYIVNFKGNHKKVVDKLKKMSFNKTIDSLIEEYELIPTFEPNDAFWSLNGNPVSNLSLWHLKKIEADKAWDITKGDLNIITAVVDSDFDPNHPDLSQKLIYTVDRFSNLPLVDQTGQHGTEVVSFVASHTNGGGSLAATGFNTRMIAYKFDNALAKIHHASLVENARVINLSFHYFPYSEIEARLVFDEVIDNGTVIVTAAGNGDVPNMNCGNQLFPFSRSFDDRIIVVSATFPNDNFGEWQNITNAKVDLLRQCGINAQYGQPYYWSASNHSNVDICAPGHYLTYATSSFNNSNPYNCCGWGTSFSSPIVAGVVSLMFSANPCLTPVEIKAILKRTTDPIPDANLFPAGTTGTGRVNAYKAVKETVTRYVQNQNLASTIITRPFVDIGSDVTTTLSQGAVNVNTNSNVSINAREVIIKNDFTVPLGSEFTINVNPNLALGCP